MSVIVLSDLLVATNVDILNSTRLQTVPANGTLTFLMSASDAIAANKVLVSIQMPDGSNPMDGVLVPQGGAAGVTGILDERTLLGYTGYVEAGGHAVFSIVETGDTEFMYRVIYQPI